MPLRSRIQAQNVYLLLTTFYAFTYSVVLTVALVYQTQAAGLSPFQLVLAGAAVQVTTFVFEVPTGAFADIWGRRLSVIIGMMLVGAAFVLMGSSTAFATILASQAILGIALTFVSGAQEAWIADEIGIEKATGIYLRSAQGVQVARLIGIPAGVGLGLIDLSFPILLGGLLFTLLAGVLIITMPEEGFEPQRDDSAHPGAGFRRTISGGLRVVRGTPILPTLFAMAAFYEIAGEVFLRLSVAHFLTNTGLPSVGNFEPVVWFGAIRMASALAGLLLLQYVRSRSDSTDPRSIGTQLAVINVLQFASLSVFAFSTEFAIGVAAYLSATSLSRIFQPLYLSMINLHVDSNVRATVISMSSQVDAFGQSLGSPLLGVLGSAVSIRAALAGAALTILPAIGLNLRANSQGKPVSTMHEPVP